MYSEVVELATERAMAYLRTRLSGEELGRYEGYYMVFKDYGADEGMRHYKSFLIMQRFVAEAWRELSERFLEVFRYPVDRVLNITPTPDGIIIVKNEWEGMLKTWMIPSIATLRWLIYEAMECFEVLLPCGLIPGVRFSSLRLGPSFLRCYGAQ
jgi:hypothetical protein